MQLLVTSEAECVCAVINGFRDDESLLPNAIAIITGLGFDIDEALAMLRRARPDLDWSIVPYSQSIN